MAVISGNANDNLLFGTPTADTLRGLAGDDNLFGGTGDDFILGFAGNDVITGGPGTELFVYDFFEGFAADNGNDRITDFHHGEDRLLLRIEHGALPEDVFDALDSNDDQKVTGADALADQVGNALVIDIDALSLVLGGPGGVASLALTGVSRLVASDFG